VAGKTKKDAMKAMSLPRDMAAESGSRRKVMREMRPLSLGAVLLALSVLVPDALGNVYWTHAFQLIGLYAVAAVAQNLLLSDAGQASFGQGAIFGISAYAVAIAVSTYALPLPVAMLLGVAAALFVGLLFALPALRVQHFYLGFVTLSAAVVLPELGMAFSDFTNGLNGISIAFPQFQERNIGGWCRRCHWRSPCCRSPRWPSISCFIVLCWVVACASPPRVPRPPSRLA
jgi:ABC-type branched-subunit amino acid transport system permease subunit